MTRGCRCQLRPADLNASVAYIEGTMLSETCHDGKSMKVPITKLVEWYALSEIVDPESVKYVLV